LQPTRRTLVGVAGIAATLSLHSLLFVIAAWGGGRASRPDVPEAVGGGANTGQPDGSQAERYMTISLSTGVPTTVPSRRSDPLLIDPLLDTSIVQVAALDSLPLPPVTLVTDGDTSVDSRAEQMAHLKFAGIYESQIRARIERAWEHSIPRHRAPGFSCRIHIVQNASGRIVEVALDLDQCLGSGELQASLSNAVFSASPLPAPPHPSVFTNQVVLTMSADALSGPLP
jgi:hypothetical protein